MSFMADYVLRRHGFAGYRQKNFNPILKKTWMVLFNIYLILWLLK